MVLNNLEGRLFNLCCLKRLGLFYITSPPFNTALAHSGGEKVRYAERSCWKTNYSTGTHGASPSDT